jgi:hypothetical protein
MISGGRKDFNAPSMCGLLEVENAHREFRSLEYFLRGPVAGRFAFWTFYTIRMRQSP